MQNKNQFGIYFQFQNKIAYYKTSMQPVIFSGLSLDGIHLSDPTGDRWKLSFRLQFQRIFSGSHHRRQISPQIDLFIKNSTNTDKDCHFLGTLLTAWNAAACNVQRLRYYWFFEEASLLHGSSDTLLNTAVILSPISTQTVTRLATIIRNTSICVAPIRP